MLVVRSPLRISLGGGGTDLPSYYQTFGGRVLAAAIDKYVYITVHERFDDLLSVRYSKTEIVSKIDDLGHPIVREVLRTMNFPECPHLDITCMADVPAGTGLGSSGSFTTALIKALHAHRRAFISPQRLARKACEIEIDILGEPIGKQDQYIAACGGLSRFDFMPDGEVDVSQITLPDGILEELEANLLLFFTGVRGPAGAILKEQDDKTMGGDAVMLNNLHLTKELGEQSEQALQAGRLGDFAELMNIHWEHKRRRSQGMSSDRIDQLFALARKSGALGGKLIGAGGGGFLMLYAEDRARLRDAMRLVGLPELKFRFDFHGTSVVAH